MVDRILTRRVLIVSTSMGAGHNGNGAEMLHRLRARGDDGLMIDQLDLLPLRLGHAVRSWYRFQLRFVPSTYERSWRSMNRMHAVLAWLNGVLCWRRLHRIIAVVEPDVIVANNPLGAQTLGHLRRTGRITVPVVTFITDFGVHELWVHQAIDMHLCVHQEAADEVTRLGGHHALATGPLVAQQFFSPGIERAAARSRLYGDDQGSSPTPPVVVVTSGSWGVGEVERTVRFLTTASLCTVVVPCGRDEDLRSRLSTIDRVTALGWTDNMAGILAAADLVIENAGGLSAMEAFAMRCPVITYRPLPGHGRHNAETMARTGVVRFARSDAELSAALESEPRADTIDIAAAIFRSDPTDALVEVVDDARLTTTAPWATAKPPRRRRGLATISVLTGLYLFGTGGVRMAVAAGVPIVKQLKPGPGEAFVAAQLNATQLGNPRVRDAIQSAGVAVVVDSATAAHSTSALRTLASHGVPIASNSDPGLGSYVRERLHHTTSSRPAQRWLADQRIAAVVLGNIDAIDIAELRHSHTALIVGQNYRPARTPGPDELHPGRLYVEDERASTPTVAILRLRQFRVVIGYQHARVVALHDASRRPTSHTYLSNS